MRVYGYKETFKITGNPATRYENPIAILLGPNCKSDGEMNAYRFKYLFNVKTFGKPTWGSLGAPSDISSAGWYMSYSFLDKYNINNPNVYLNRKEYPIDFPVWHNRNDVAAGKDAIVEKALEWINNLVYPHNVRLDKNYYPLAGDTLNIFTSVEKIILGLESFYDVLTSVEKIGQITDLELEENILSQHISEAIQYRSLDREFWNA